MRTLVLLTALFFASSSFATSIWHVKGDRELYLFGTIHVLKPDSYPLPAVYDRTLDKCDSIWLEVDNNELADTQLLQAIQQKMRLPAGQTLNGQLSDSAIQQLTYLADQAGVSLSLLQGLKPWAAANQLTLMIFQQKGFTGEGLDMHLQRVAEQKGIPVKAFETFRWQIDMFDELSMTYADEFVDFSTEDMDDVGDMVNELYQNWVSGNYEALYKQAAFDNFPEIEAKMLTDRNNAWMKTLRSQPKKDVTCVAVGALHMAGNAGLISQFRKINYAVSQVDE